jgi:hypothetical protein
MFDKMIGTVFRRADQAHKEHVAGRAKTLGASTRALIGMTKAMLAAKACGEDQIATVERVMGRERLNTLVAEVDKVVTVRREDNLSEIVDRFPAVHRTVPILLGTFVFLSCQGSGDSLLAALDALRDRLRSGDIWVEGSRAFRPFDDFLLPLEVFEARHRKDELGLAVSGRFDEWRAKRVGLLESRLQEIDAIAFCGKLAEAVITAEGLSISPIRAQRSSTA